MDAHLDISSDSDSEVRHPDLSELTHRHLNFSELGLSHTTNFAFTMDSAIMPTSEDYTDMPSIVDTINRPHLEDPNSPDYICVSCNNTRPLCMQCQEMVTTFRVRPV